MKIIVSNIIFLLLIISAGKAEVGISLGPYLKPSLIKDNVVWLTGSKIGTTFDNTYYVGISVYGSTFDTYHPNVEDANYILYPEFSFNFISIETEYNFSPESNFFVSLSLNNGISLAKFDIPYSLDENNNLYVPEYRENTLSYFTEPGINFNFNFKSFYKLNLCLSYRYVFLGATPIAKLLQNNKQFYLDNSYLNGLNLSLSIRFGSF